MKPFLTPCGRVASIKALFDAAAADLAKPEIDTEVTDVHARAEQPFESADCALGQVVTNVWNKINPGLLGSLDAPSSLRLIAPRPLLVVNGELDPRCTE